MVLLNMPKILCDLWSLKMLQRQILHEAMRLAKAGCHPKMRQDVAVHVFAHHKTACLLTASPLACHEAAAGEPVKRRFREKSGRRDSNPRQPAWKADRRKITARSFSSSFRRAFTHRTHHSSSIEVDGRAHWEADSHPLSL